MKDLRNFLEAKGFYRISLKKLKTGHYCFTVFINSVSGTFILDTGASTSCMGNKAAKTFLLNIKQSDVKAAGAGAINMLTSIAEKNTIKIGAWGNSYIDLVVFDMTHVNEALAQAEEKPVAGIIGADFLKKTRAVIDYGRNCFYVK